MELKILNFINKKYVLLIYNSHLNLMRPYLDFRGLESIYVYDLKGFDKTLNFDKIINFRVSLIDSEQQAREYLRYVGRFFLEEYTLYEIYNCEFTGKSIVL